MFNAYNLMQQKAMFNVLYAVHFALWCSVVFLSSTLKQWTMSVILWFVLQCAVYGAQCALKQCAVCLRTTSVLMELWLWVGVKGHLNIQPMPHKPDNGYHLHHHRYHHHHHPQPYHLNNKHPQVSTQQPQHKNIPSSPHFHNNQPTP